MTPAKRAKTPVGGARTAWRRAGGVMLAAVAATPAGAQSSGAIGAEALSRQQAAIQPAPARPAAIEPAPAVAAVAADAGALVAGPPFVLTGVSFDASAFLAAGQLRAVAAPYLGRTVTDADLAAIVAGVDALYDRRSLVTARALLGPVVRADGTVHVALVEGRVGKVSVTGNGRLPAATAIERAGLVPGAVVDVATLGHRLALLNRSGDTQTRATLQPGERFGLTDVALSMEPPKANVLQLFADDYGYDSAGRYQGSAYYRRTGLFGASDRFTGFVSGSAGLLSGTAAYDAPLLGPTSRVGLSYGRGRTDIVDGRFAALQSRGLIDNEAVTVSRPLASGAASILTGSLTVGISDTRNYLNGTFVGHSRTHRAGGGLTYGYAAPGTSAFVSVNGLYADAPLDGAAAKSEFALFSGIGNAEHLFGRLAGLHVGGGWQVATAGGLPSDLLFQIGGATTVRGYRQGELTGDGGYWVNVEAELFPLRRPTALTLFAFADQGRIFTQYDQARQLAAAGLGLSAAVGPHLTLRVTGGAPLIRIGDEARRVRVFARLGVAF